LPELAAVKLEMFDVGGRRVASQTLHPSNVAPSAFPWTPGVRAPGIYLVRVSSVAGFSATTRVVVLD
jgi:hypothetical protein